ncbi:MAG: hypothetical protein GXP42_19835 [Chloroflexi bacterium]|nr:hypothetical protein [Chloroflexota bacterium]
MSLSNRQYPTSLALGLGLLLLFLGYWRPWLPHPAAGLNILGVDLPEYVKFIPEVRYGQTPVNRLVFFGPLLALAFGLVLLASLQRSSTPWWLRTGLAAAAIPTALAMLPPAWTPGLLRTPEFRTQTMYIGLVILVALLTPLWRRWLPDRIRGLLFALLALPPIQSLLAYEKLLPALEKLYAHPLSPGAAYYLVGFGAACLFLGGLFLASSRSKVEG